MIETVIGIEMTGIEIVIGVIVVVVIGTVIGLRLDGVIHRLEEEVHLGEKEHLREGVLVERLVQGEGQDHRLSDPGHLGSQRLDLGEDIVLVVVAAVLILIRETCAQLNFKSESQIYSFFFKFVVCVMNGN